MATTVRTLQNFVDGQWVDATGEETREIVSPVTGDVCHRIADLIDERREAFARELSDHLEDAVAKGAEIVVGGSRDGGRPTQL